jgi:predicted nucleic acid-binding protein
MVTHPRGNDKNRKVTMWLKSLIKAGVKVVIPEIADYEVRREMLRAGLHDSVVRLDGLKETLTYLPLSTDAMLRAARFWADARNTGQPTAKNDALDADVILAGQAVTYAAAIDEAVIATTNVKHLTRFTSAAHWETIK